MTRPQTSTMFSLLSVTNTNELSIMPIITNTANNIIENLVLFFLALFISFCGGSSSDNNIASSAHLILIPQQRKSLYYMLKKTSDQDQSQVNINQEQSQLNIKNYKSKKSRSQSTQSTQSTQSCRHRPTSANPTTSY
ncbi:3376_t:CDS:2 [Gigaspora rosea]|nr:3376_t:CDS:2 [Gigaspora rosea]